MFDDLTVVHWILLGMLAVMYVLSCVRVAMRMHAIGRSGVMWFFITLCLTFVPALIVLRRRSRAMLTARMFTDARRCPHCSGVLTGEGAADGRCPHCNMPLREGDVA
jgi:hypothetical protein